MAFAEGDIDNDGRFEPLAADMKPYGSGADIDAACAPVLPPDAYYTGRPGHTPMPSRCGTRPARSATAWPASGVDATGWNWSAQFGGLGYDGDLNLYTVNGMVGEAFGYLPGAELLLTGWPVPRRASKPAPNAVAERVEVLEVSSSAFARSGRPPAMSGSKPRGPRGPHHTL